MERLTEISGIGEFELCACMKCGNGCGSDNENCGYCEKPEEAYQMLGAYEETGLSPEEIINLNDFSKSQCAALLSKNGELKQENAELKKALERACVSLSNRASFHSLEMMQTCAPKNAAEYMTEFIQQAKEAVAHDH